MLAEILLALADFWAATAAAAEMAETASVEMVESGRAETAEMAELVGLSLIKAAAVAVPVMELVATEPTAEKVRAGMAASVEMAEMPIQTVRSREMAGKVVVAETATVETAPEMSEMAAKAKVATAEMLEMAVSVAIPQPTAATARAQDMATAATG